MSYIPGVLLPHRPEELIYEVREVTSFGERRSFARLPLRIYRGDRYWTPKSLRSRSRSLSPKHNPALDRLSVGMFMAESQNGVLGAETIGGIAVWLDRDAPERSVARFGMFEVANNPEVAESLIETAEFWLMERFPIEAIRGPFSLDESRAPGLLVDGFDVYSGPYLPYNPPYYPEMLDRAGYEPAATALAYALGVGEQEGGGSGDVRAIEPQRDPAAWTQLLALGSPHMRAAATATRNASGLAIPDERRGGIRFGLILIPDGGGTPSPSVLVSLFRRTRRRLLALPVATMAGDQASAELRELYAKAMQVAMDQRFGELMFAPIPAEDARGRAILESLGAHPVQTYQVLEKRLS